MFSFFAIEVQKIKEHFITGMKDKSIKHVESFVQQELMYRLIHAYRCLYIGYYEEFHKYKVYSYAHPKGTDVYRKSLQMPKLVCEEMTKLIFSEGVELSIGITNKEGKIEDDEFTQAYIDSVFETNDFWRMVEEATEKMFAMGGKIEKIYTNQNNEIRYEYISADLFIPISWNNQKIYEALFVTFHKERKYYYTRFEYHLFNKETQTYQVTNTLYRSDRKYLLGSEKDFKKHEVNITELFPDLEPVTDLNGITEPVFVYTKPNITNNKDTESPLGISLYGNAVDILEHLDVTFDSFYNEIVMSRKKLIVADSALKGKTDILHGKDIKYYDPNDSIYVPMNFDTAVGGNPITEINSTIRAEDLVKSIKTSLDLLATQIGFSAGTFSFDGQSIQTATQVISEQSKTFRSKVKHEKSIAAGIEELIIKTLEQSEANGITFEGQKVTNPENLVINIRFDDSIIVDDDKKREQERIDVSEGNMPRSEYIKNAYQLTDEEAAEWLKRVDIESQGLFDIDDSITDDVDEEEADGEPEQEE